jgi:hypothetical protein
MLGVVCAARRTVSSNDEPADALRGPSDYPPAFHHRVVDRQMALRVMLAAPPGSSRAKEAGVLAELGDGPV